MLAIIMVFVADQGGPYEFKSYTASRHRSG